MDVVRGINTLSLIVSTHDQAHKTVSKTIKIGAHFAAQHTE